MKIYTLYVPLFITASLSAMDQKMDIASLHELGDLPSSKDYNSDSSDHDSVNDSMVENALVEKHQNIFKFIKKRGVVLILLRR